MKGDTTRKDFRPTGIRIGTDALAIARNFYDESFKGWEVNADVDFWRYYLAVDVGTWSREFTDSGYYKSEGNYWRIGADVNFIPKDPDRNVAFFGLRYGHSTFSEYYEVETTDPVWGTYSNTYTNDDVNARWFELTAGLKVKIWKMIWLGYTGRFKFGLHTNATGPMLPSDVPGYGRTDDKTTWGFNYQIFFRIPVRKASGPLKQ